MIPSLVAGAALLGSPMSADAKAKAHKPVAPTTAAAQPAATNQRLVDFIKSVENSKNYKPGGWRDGKWFQYMDRGVPAIGYGHRLFSGERFPDGITDDQATELVKRDVAKARSNMYGELKKRFNFTGTLDADSEAMLTDFEYNLGTIKTFPKFVRAVLTKDWKTAAAEHKRFSDGKEISRNKPFYDTFLANKVKASA